MAPKNNSDILNIIQDQMRKRLAELQPAVNEYNEIQTALRRLKSPIGRPKGSKNKPKTETTVKS